MPQMNPMMWLFLFLMFIIIFLMVNPLIFFSKNYNISSSSLKSSFKLNTWKW
uniref:ATP synthase complex subunit 8 n=1 Tax=Lachesilla sp. LaspMLY TaxID=2597020 RepID=A0A8K1ZG04_9NEOP|nr:ATP synthase F0 subunit 8 [Lachesilla sp. LaspMLY]